MPMTGPPPKAAKLGHSAAADWLDIPNVPYAEGEQRQLHKLGRRKWHDLVVAWWEQVRVMPHCVLWRETDWIFAAETAQMKHEYLTDEKPSTTMATEIRRREDKMGVTLDALRQLRIRYVDPPEYDDGYAGEPELVVQQQTGTGTGPGTVTPLSSRRGRLTKSQSA